MKKKMSLKIALMTGGLVLAGPQQSQADTIAKWTFETSPLGPAPVSGVSGTSPGSFIAEVGTGTATGSHASSATRWYNPGGDGSAKSLASIEWGIGDYYEFASATTGFEDITITWAQDSSTGGPGGFKLAYQINGGVFTNFLDYTVSLVPWNKSSENVLSQFSADLSDLSALDNATSVVLRLIMRTDAAVLPPDTVVPPGADLVDNFTISGTPVPEASTWFAGRGLSSAVLGMLTRKNRR